MINFSIIIATFNRRESLLKTIESILKQEYKSYELIIIDDGSTDGTEGSLKKLIDDKTIIYKYQSNKGVPAARNAGISMAKYDYLTFLDSDILCSPYWLQNIYEILVSEPDIGILGTWPILGKYYRYYDYMKMKGCPSGIKISDVSQVGGGVATVKKNIFEKIGKLDETGKFGLLEDTEICWRAVLCGYRVTSLYEILTFHVKDMTSTSRLPSKIAFYEILKNKIYIYLKLLDLKNSIFYSLKAIASFGLSLIKDPSYIYPYVKALVWHFMHFPFTLKKRFLIRKMFTRTPQYLYKLWNDEKVIDLRNKAYYDEIDLYISHLEFTAIQNTNAAV